MKQWVARIAIILAVASLAGPASDWLGLRSIGAWLAPPAAAIIGMPLTPVSVAGVARRTVRRTAYVAGAATIAATTAVAVGTAAAVASAAVATAAVGSVVPGLPVGCASVPAGGVAYYNCGGVFYKPYYQSANLVYVVVPAP